MYTVRAFFNRGLWTVSRLVAVIPPILFLALCVLIAHREFDRSRGLLWQAIAVEVSAALDAQVTVDSVASASPWQIEVRGLRISKQSFGTLLTARRASARYSLVDMLRNLDAPASTVSSVNIVGPVVYLERDRSGRLNYQEAFRPKGRVKKRFHGVITVSDGQVRYVDHALTSKTKAPLHLLSSGVSARISLQAPDGGEFSGTVSRTNASEKVEVEGAFGYKGGLVVDVQGQRVSLPFLDPFLGASPDLHLYSGTLSGRLLLTRRTKPKPTTHVWVEGQMREAAVQLPGHLPRLESVNASVALAGADYLRVDGSARAAGTQWRVKGAVLSLAKPTVWIDLVTSQADYSRLKSLAPAAAATGDVRVGGRGPLAVRARGPLSALMLSGQAQIPHLSYSGRSFSDTRASFTFAEGKLSLPSFSAKIGGGTVSGSGTAQVLMGRPRLQGQARFDNVSLAQLDTHLKGRASGNAVVTLADGRPGGAVSFHVQNPVVYGRHATSAVGRAHLAGRKISVESLLVSTPRGFVTASGEVALNGPVNLNVTAVGLSARDILGASQTDGVSGWLSADGRVLGSLSSPSFEGRVQILDAVYQGHALDSISGDLTASRHRISTPGLTVTGKQSEFTIVGDVIEPLSAQPRLQLTASIASLSAQDFATVAPAFADMQGQVSGELKNVSGPLRSLRADFDFTIEGARYRTYSASYVNARGSFDRGTLTLDNLQATRGQATLIATGTVGRDKSLDFDFRLEGMPLGDVAFLAMNRQMPVSGTVDVFGHVGGDSAGPVVSASLTGSDLGAGGEQLGVSRSEIVWRDNLLEVDAAVLSVAGGRMSVEDVKISTDPDTAGVLSARLRIGQSETDTGRVDLVRLLAMVRGLGVLADLSDSRVRDLALQAPERVQGSLAGTVSVTRQTGGTLVVADWNINALQAWGTPLGQVNVKASTGPMGTTVHSLQIEDHDMLITASGSLARSGELTADVEGHNVELSRIPVIKGVSDAAGTADFSFEASGTLSDPKAVGSLTVSGANIAGLPIERFTTGQIIADAHSINVAESTLVSSDQRIRIEGTAPFSLSTLSFVEGGEFDIHAQAVNPTLKTLSLITSRIDTERTSGDMVARVDVTGKWPSPQLNGLISVDGGTLAVKNMATVFGDVNVNILLQGDQVNIERFTMRSSDGGVLSVTGGARSTDKGWALNASAQAENMGLKLRNVTRSFDESYNGKLNMNLQASGSPMHPLIAGRITLQNGVVGMPTLPEKPEQALRFAFNPTFDLSLVAGDRMKARGPRMNVDVRGQLRVAQTLQDPLVTGNLDVLSGYLLFPGTRFRVVPVGKLSYHYDAPEGARVTMDIRAETQISSGLASTAFSGTSYRVEMHASGSPEDPKVTFQSYPPGLETNRIFALLGERAGVGPSGFDSQGGFEKEVARLFTANIAPGVLEPVESAIAEALGFQEVTFGFGQYEPMNVMLRRKLFDGVSIQYWRSLEAAQEQEEWKLLYDVTDRLRLTYGRNRFDMTSIGIEGSLGF